MNVCPARWFLLRQITAPVLAAALLAPLHGQAAPRAPARGQAVHLSGVVTVVHVDDLAHHASRVQYQLADPQTGKHTALRFDGAPPEELRTGVPVRLTGSMDDDGSVLVSAAAAGAQAAQPMQTTTATAASAAATVVSGVQNTIAIIANFTDATVTPTPAQIQDLLFTDPNGYSIDALFRETSFGNVGFSGQVAGPFVINFSTTSTCNLAAFADAADAAATASGVNLASYPRHLYIMPSAEMGVCGADGAGQVGGSPSRAWVFNNTVNDVYAHELGHNLNMAHAATLANQYGDASDDMSAGGYALRHFNAPHMEQMGWMPAGNIATVTQSGTYTVAALELNPGQAPAPQIIKIAKPDTGDYYYFSYRQPLGLDSGLRSAYWNRINVHKYTGTYGANNTFLLQLLDDAGVFSDTTNGITVTQVSHASDRATVNIQISGTPTCQSAAPTITLTPTSQSAGAGTALAYALSLTNKDNSACAASTFSFASVVPSGWTGAVSPATLNLAPGASGSATLTVTSAASATSATYTVPVNVADAAHAAHATSGSVAYVVQTPQCTRSAPAIGFSPSSRSGYAGTSLSYTVSVTNKDSSSCTASTFSLGKVAPAGWAATISPTTMSLSPGATSSATLLVTSAANAVAATYPIQASVTDSASTIHSASAGGSDVVQADTQAPTTPTGVAASVAKRTNVSLTWQPATDNVSVAGYEVWRNGARVATTVATSYAETLANGTYSYYVVAFDGAGNRSAPSSPVSLTIKSR